MDNTNDSVQCIDLVRKNITAIPDYVFKCTNLKMLSLDGNLLEALPHVIFTQLPFLNWLDVRNNLIVEIPTEGLACHSYLETLLLQGNQIKILPVELGRVKNLKTLQLSNNPITYPPNGILELGFKAIKQFLAEQYSKSYEQSQVENETKNEKPRLKSELTSGERKKRSRNCKPIKSNREQNHESATHNSEHTFPLISIKSFSAKRPQSECNEQLKSTVSQTSHKSAIGGLKKTPIFNTDRYLSKEMGDNELRVQRETLREEWRKRVKEILEKQAAVIQRHKTIAVLKQWRSDLMRHKYKNVLVNYDNNLDKFPYDTDPQYDKILSRNDLKNINLKKTRLSPKEKEKVDIDAEIFDIMESVKRLESLQGEHMSPRTQKKILENEINQLNQLQKKLNELKYTNTEII